MPRAKISEFSTTAGDNTDIDGINLAEGCAPSGINDAIRELMAQLKDFQSGAAGDNITVVGTLAAKGTSSSGADLKLYEDTDNGTNYVGFIAPASIASNVQWTLPSADGSSGQALQTNGSGTLSFATLGISAGGTGQTTANAAFNALAPSQTGNSGRYLTTDGTNTSWAVNPLGTVTSVAMSVPSFLSVAGSPITSSGTLAVSLSGTALPTANGGTGLTSFTANGVVYASSSSALATGSALTFDGTTLTNTRNTTDGSAATLTLNNSGATASYATLNLNAGSVNYQQFADAAGNAIGAAGVMFRTTTNHPLVWGVNNSEAMRLTSTSLYTASGINVGIGTSSPGYKLSIAGAAGSAAINLLETSVRSWAIRAGGTATNTFDIADLTAGQTRLTLDSSGNLGLGVTPSAWSLGRVLQLQNGASLISYADSAYLNANAYFDGSWKYLGNAAASRYEMGAAHTWYTAASGTAGDTISFTQAMTLTSGGNLLLGGTTDNARVNIQAGGLGQFIIAFNGTSANYYDADLQVFRSANATERARITSGGNLLVGTTSSLSGTSHSFQATGTDASFYAGVYRHDGTGGNGRVLAWQLPNTNNVTSYFVYATNSDGNCLNIFGNGNITNSNNSYGGISDAKLKENVIDATPKLDKLNQVRVVSYNLKSNPEQKLLGVVAQELEQIFPGMVEETTDRDAEGNDLGTVTKGVKYSVFVPMLIKAIQEQQVLINDLRARVAQLEAK